METSEIEDMIINCVALGFILQIDARDEWQSYHFFFPVRIRSSLLTPVPQCEATPMLSSAFAAQTYLWLWENHHLVEMELNQFIPFARGINRCCPDFFNANGPAVQG